LGIEREDPLPAASAASQLTVEMLQQQVAALGILVDNLAIDLKDGAAAVKGVVRTQGGHEKVALAIGSNPPGVARVDDQLAVKVAEAVATFYTVEGGDKLSANAGSQDGGCEQIARIFKANKPMLQDPNKIHPGRLLRIPPKV